MMTLDVGGSLLWAAPLLVFGQCCVVVAIKLILYLAYFTLGKWARDDSFLDTIMAMDRRAMVSKENEDLRAKEMHDERLLHSHKAQESDDQLLMVMQHHADSAARQVEVSARQVEQQNTFQAGLLAVLSELIKSNRPSIQKLRKTCRR